MKNIFLRGYLQKLLEIFKKTLKKNILRKYSRGSNILFMKKSLSSAHIKRGRLRNC